MLLLIEFVMFYTFMNLGTKCPDCEIRNADFAEIDLIGITVHLRLSVPVELPEGIEVLQFCNLSDLSNPRPINFANTRVFRMTCQASLAASLKFWTADLWLHLGTGVPHLVSVFAWEKTKARRNAEGLNDDGDDISRAWDDLEQLRLVVIKWEQASHKLTAQLHQATLELKDVPAGCDGLQADIQRLRESNQVCSCRRQRPVVHEPTCRPRRPTHCGKRGGPKHDSFTTARPASSTRSPSSSSSSSPN